ncbi:hypothetical protein M569_07389 [Genlisea aurea]|uniref:Uncharacterized protein n=1 Tax=Genlisea aurea TaxID=192259 RepID=S8CRC4_9LAMI|nr:hypothetical protein M569_07389 [Genlisea aurea]
MLIQTRILYFWKLNLYVVVVLWFYEQSRSQFGNLYVQFANSLSESRRKYVPSAGIAVSMIFAVSCCVTAAAVESRRLGVVKKYGLVDKPDATVPMSMFWLLPQFVLLGGFSGMFSTGTVYFFVDQSPVFCQKRTVRLRGGESELDGGEGDMVSARSEREQDG